MTDPFACNGDLALLAPGFRDAVEEALAKCNDPARPGGPLDAIVFEAFRSNARQAYLYAQGRTRPGAVVTNASSSLTSWHGYGLAVDVVHRTGFWTPFGEDAKRNEQWFAEVAAVFKATRCNWGGDWTKPDTPHMQWGRMPASPSAAARASIASRGAPALWAAFQASAESPPGTTAGAAAPPPTMPTLVAATSGTYRSLVAGGFFSDSPDDLTIARAVRTNNPAGLSVSSWQHNYPGFKGSTTPSQGGAISIYCTPEHGVGAWLHLIAIRYGVGCSGTLTLAQLAQHYSGVSDPAAPAVRNYLAGWMQGAGGGIAPDTPIHLDDDRQLVALARAMFAHEAHKPSPLSDQQILFGIAAERAGTLPKT